MPLIWNHSIRLPGLAIAIALATMQSASGQAPTAENATVAALQQPPDTAALERAVRTIDAEMARRLWDDPQIKNFIGLSENAYDFTDPNGSPGFGVHKPTEAAR